MKTTSTLLFLLLHVFAFAQNPSSKLLERAESYYTIKQYSQAIPDFERLLCTASNPSVRLKLADCYCKTNQEDKALLLYKQLTSENTAADTITLLYAALLKKKREYAKAKEQYLRLYTLFPQKIWYRIYAQYCDSALSYSNKPTNTLQVENLQKLNSENSDVAPVAYKGGLVFSSNREATRIRKKTGNTNLPLFDLYIATGKDSIRPDLVSPFSLKLNTVQHECCASFTADYKKMFYTRSIDEQPGDGKGIKNTLKMFSATWDGTNWEEIHTFRFNDSTHSYGQPSVAAEEELFFFASDRIGGFGGTDLYVCFNIDHKWTDPVNLGAGVNSAYNELYPFFHPDGALYFSSNRPEGFGGYDIYKVLEDENGDYGTAVNSGFPINSEADELSMYWSADYRVGYFSSNRAGGKGLEDLYLVWRK